MLIMRTIGFVGFLTFVFGVAWLVVSPFESTGGLLLQGLLIGFSAMGWGAVCGALGMLDYVCRELGTKDIRR